MIVESSQNLGFQKLTALGTLKRAPRILYLSAYWPRTLPTCGGEWRAHKIGSALRQIGEVETMIVGSEPGEEVSKEEANELDVSKYIPVSVRAEKRWAEKLEWFLDPRGAYPHGVGVGAEATTELVRRIPEFDLIWWENFRVPNMFAKWAWDRSILDIDDLPSSIERSYLREASNLKTRLIQLMRINSWTRREKVLGRRFNVLVTASDADRDYLRKLGCEVPIHVVQNGFKMPGNVPTRRPSTRLRIGFLGPLTFLPNFEGIHWFINDCWPLIRGKIPDVRLRIVGRKSETRFENSDAGIDELGWLPEIEDEIASWSLMIVPIRLGGGTRVKIAHALSLKCPVVATRFGAYGYNLHDGVEILLGDTKKDFAGACVRMLQNPDLANQIAERGWESFLKTWSWDAIQPRVWSAVEDCLRLVHRRTPDKL